MYISLDMLEPLLALAAGILCLVLPKQAPYVVALYLIAIGVLGLLPYV